MKKLMYACCLVLCFAAFCGQAYAATILSRSFSDDYVGGTDGVATNFIQNGGDVISQWNEVNSFDVTGMTVDIYTDNDGNTWLKVSIETNYYENIGEFGTVFGDLFISSTGYNGDDTVWDYAFDVSSNTLYSIPRSSDAILTSDYCATHNDWGTWQSSWYRNSQMVLVNTDTATGLISGESNGNDSEKKGDNYDMYINITELSLDYDDLGFYWTMSCGNDVIQCGTNSVPVPGGICLLGWGLIAVAGIKRRNAGSGGRRDSI